MSFDPATRNRLAKLVGDARTLLTAEFFEQCRSVFGITPSGEMVGVEQLGDLDDAERATATVLRERVQYLLRTHPDEKESASHAVTQVVREQAFTVLNRFAALRMAEKRGLIAESVGRGYQSKGFKVFETVVGTGLGDTYGRYRQYLRCLFDEFAIDLGVLFDRRSPQGLLFPRESALLECLTLINAPDVEDLWAEDETIGWVYQYYNDPAERKKMREAPAPRTSRELAVRNQFFTPRYVVEFLTDNTIGRIWYEMTQGDTVLKDQCRYLVRRPTEVFLAPGDPLTGKLSHTGLSQNERLNQPVYIPHRPLKDPREIRMIDPACGSMHFGLYAFDLFETIYAEAWNIARGTAESLNSSAEFRPFVSFVARYHDRRAFFADVPRLIIEHNLHGIDIDRRATQIAGLSLWLRAQRSWQQQELHPQSRPRVRRSNIVCAEPMPGDEVFVEEFIDTYLAAVPERKLLGQLVRRVFDVMTLAAEAGSLLRVDEEISDAVAEAKQKWVARPRGEQGRLFATGVPDEQEIRLDVTGITDETFWQKAEERIYAALNSYAEQGEYSGDYQRRLFADDTSHGFAFIDLCRKRYDVVVMNPPFGEMTPGFKKYAAANFKKSKADMLCMFVERAISILSTDGYCAAITNRTPFFTDGTEDWRDAFCLGGQSTALDLFADLGKKVLDAALVETVAYSITKAVNRTEIAWFNVTQVQGKEHALLEQIQSGGGGIARLADIRTIPGKRLAYWLPASVIRCYDALPSLASSVDSVDKGMSTTDDFRFVRAFWEVPDGPSPVGWMYYSKGGDYSPFASDIHLAVKWADGGREISETITSKYPYLHGDSGWVLHPETHHGSAGLTYTKRTASSFSARFLPAGARVSDLANLVFDTDIKKLLGTLVCLSSSPFHYLLDAAVPSIDSSEAGGVARHYEVGTLREVPVPVDSLVAYSEPGGELFQLAQRRYIADETTNYFRGLPGLRRAETLAAAAAADDLAQLTDELKAIQVHAKEERRLLHDYGLDEPAIEAIYDYMGPHPASLPDRDLKVLVEPTAVWRHSQESLSALLVSSYGGKRRFSKQTWIGGRELELWSFVSNLHPAEIVSLLSRDEQFFYRNGAKFCERLLSFVIGCGLGRWDIRFATGEKPALALPDPSAPLPVCPPGQLQNEQGLAIDKDDVDRMKDEGRWNYPIEVPWDGILVDDPGHPQDIEARAQQVLQVIWKHRWESIELEACQLLGVRTLRDYIRRPAGFFADHLKRYSKSRRQAPIYWPLSTAKGNYTLWVYYHRLTDQTLHTALVDFVDPKIRATERALIEARAANRRQDIDDFADMLLELQEFRSELERITRLPWKPNLNDGVLITASPLWKLFRLPKWRRDLKSCWEALAGGEYDWAHSALTIWPDRVRATCEKNRPVAIAHGLEHLFKGPTVPSRSGRNGLAAGSTAG